MILIYSHNAAVLWSILDAGGQRWNTSGTPAFEAHVDGNWADYLVADAAVGTSATRTLTLPTLADGRYALEGYDTDAADLGDVPDLSGTIVVRDGELVDGLTRAAAANVTQVAGQAVASDGAGVQRVQLATRTVSGDADAVATIAGQAAIEADTQDLQSRVPAALIGGRIDASVGAMADDVITAAAHDQATAHPLAQADAAATAVARVGADGDTLETISDQIDEVMARTDLITASAVTVTVGTHVAADGVTLTLVQGEAYLASISNAIDITVTDERLPDTTATDGTIPVLRIAPLGGTGTALALPGTVQSFDEGTSTAVFRFEVTAAQSATLRPGDEQNRYEVDVQVAGSATNLLTPIADARCTVREQVA